MTDGNVDPGLVGPPKVVHQRSTDAEPSWGRQFFVNAGTTGRDLFSDGCFHDHAEPIDTVDGQRVGWLCPDCDRALPTVWDAFAGLEGRQKYAAEALMMAGYSPYDVAGMVMSDERGAPIGSAATALDHEADACPARVEITALADRERQYVHGNCEVTDA